MFSLIWAHLGGIDEIGIFVVPALLAVLALRWTERRAKRREMEQSADVTAEEATHE